MAIESTAIPLPSEIVMPLAGWKLVEEKDLGFAFVVLVGLAGAVGSLAGSLIEYYVARAGGRPLIEKYGKYLLITNLTVFVARMIPGVRGFIAIPAGIARMNVWKFALFTFVGALPWTFGLALGGYFLGANYDDIRSVTRPFDVPIILVILGLVSWFVWHRVREIRAESREAALAAPTSNTDESD
jgi:membrane protein DedA with SNARE-associated domain